MNAILFEIILNKGEVSDSLIIPCLCNLNLNLNICMMYLIKAILCEAFKLLIYNKSISELLNLSEHPPPLFELYNQRQYCSFALLPPQQICVVL